MILPETIEKVWELWEEGHRQWFIAEQVGISPSSVQRILSKPRPGVPPFCPLSDGPVGR